METFDLFPVRCYTCNKVLGRYQSRWEDLIMEGYLPSEIFDILEIERYCCRMNMLSPAKILLEPEEAPIGSIAISRKEPSLKEEISHIQGAVNDMAITDSPSLPSGGVLNSMASSGKSEVEPQTTSVQTTTAQTTGVPSGRLIQISSLNMPRQLETTGHPVVARANIHRDPNKAFRVIKTPDIPAAQFPPPIQPLQIQQQPQIQQQSQLQPPQPLQIQQQPRVQVQIQQAPPQQPQVQIQIQQPQNLIQQPQVQQTPIMGGIPAITTLESLGL